MNTVKKTKKKLAEFAATLMSGADEAAADEQYTNLLEAVQTGNRNEFEDLCNKKGINDDKVILELWAAAVGTMSKEAQAAYPGSAGW